MAPRAALVGLLAMLIAASAAAQCPPVAKQALGTPLTPDVQMLASTCKASTGGCENCVCGAGELVTASILKDESVTTEQQLRNAIKPCTDVLYANPTLKRAIERTRCRNRDASPCPEAQVKSNLQEAADKLKQRAAKATANATAPAAKGPKPAIAEPAANATEPAEVDAAANATAGNATEPVADAELEPAAANATEPAGANATEPAAATGPGAPGTPGAAGAEPSAPPPAGAEPSSAPKSAPPPAPKSAADERGVAAWLLLAAAAAAAVL